jgi:hypothetical protein
LKTDSGASTTDRLSAAVDGLHAHVGPITPPYVVPYVVKPPP